MVNYKQIWVNTVISSIPAIIFGVLLYYNSSTVIDARHTVLLSTTSHDIQTNAHAIDQLRTNYNALTIAVAKIETNQQNILIKLARLLDVLQVLAYNVPSLKKDKT